MTWETSRRQLAALLNGESRTENRRPDPTVPFFWSLLAAQTLFWLILPVLTQPNAPRETLELLVYGKEWAWGYPSHPPLAVWLASAACALTAPSIWPIYLLSQICVCVSVWCAWILGRRFLSPWTALCAAVALLGGYAFTISTTDFSGAQLAGCLWSLTILAFHEALTRPRRRYWIATGTLLGLGMLCSYGTFVLLAGMVSFVFIDPRARRCLDSSWPFLAAVMMAVVVLPHALWLMTNDSFITALGLESSQSIGDHLIHSARYLGEQLLSLIPVIILLSPLVGWFSFQESTASVEHDQEFARRYLLWMTCLPPAAILALTVLAGPSSIVFSRVTLWTYLGIVVLLWSHLDEKRISWRRVILRVGTACGTCGAILVALNMMVPRLSAQAGSVHFPGKQLSKEVAEAWKAGGHSDPMPVLDGPADLVQNVTWYAGKQGPQRTTSEWPNPTKNEKGKKSTGIVQTGGMVIWNADEDARTVQTALATRYGRVNVLKPVSLSWQVKGVKTPVRVGMAIVSPADGETVLEPTPSAASYEFNQTGSELDAILSNGSSGSTESFSRTDDNWSQPVQSAPAPPAYPAYPHLDTNAIQQTSQNSVAPSQRPAVQSPTTEPENPFDAYLRSATRPSAGTTPAERPPTHNSLPQEPWSLGSPAESPAQAPSQTEPRTLPQQAPTQPASDESLDGLALPPGW